MSTQPRRFKVFSRLPSVRAWNIAFRTAHIGVMSVLVGGCVFEVSELRLQLWLSLTILTGACLTLIEAWGAGFRWVYQGRGVAVLAKLVLLCLIPWFGTHRELLLATAIVLASVGSHMPGRFRYYSLVHGRVLDE